MYPCSSNEKGAAMGNEQIFDVRKEPRLAELERRIIEAEALISAMLAEILALSNGLENKANKRGPKPSRG